MTTVELCELAVLHAAAVLGRELDPALLPDVAGQPPAVVDRALDRLARDGVLNPDPRTGRWRFGGEAARIEAYSAAGAGWLRAAHARAAAALRDRGASPDRFADHLVAGGRPVIGELVGAAARGRWRDPRAATRWLAFAFEHAPSAGVLVRLAEVLAASGDLDAARASLAELPADGRLRVRALITACRIGLAAGNYAETIALAQRELDGGHPVLLAQVAVVHALDGDPAAARALAEKAAGRCPVSGAALALVRCLDGAYAEAAAAAGAAGEAVDGLTDGELVPRLECVAWLGLADSLLGRPAPAERRIGRALRLARQRRQMLPLGWLLLAGGFTSLVHGELATARARLHEVATITAGWGDGHLGRVAIALGSFADAVTGAAGEPSTNHDHGTPGEPRWARALRTYALARHRLLDADPVGCLAALERTGGALAGELFVRAAIEAGDLEAARRRVEALAAESLGAVSGAYTRLATARLALAGGDPAAAAESALAARDVFAGRGMRLAAGEAGIVAGRAQAANGDHRAAHLTLRRADEALAACGASRLGDEAARELRRLGRHVARRVRPAARRAHQAQPLSPREHEIAQLVASGMTNRQIAGALFISEKTVERHLSSVFLKLGISNRAAVALRLISREPLSAG